MAALGIRIIAGFALAFSGYWPAAAEEAAVCGGKAITARITEVLDGASVRLEDGRVVRLAYVVPPMPIDGDRQALLRAKEALAEMAKDKFAAIYLSSDAIDRYGRLSAHSILIDEKIWLEGELLSRGFVRALPVADDRCMTALLSHESKARSPSKGIWTGGNFGVFDAKNIEALLEAEGRFVVVEGTVRRVGESRGRLYLDFGRRFREDFTIIVPDRTRKIFAARGSDLKSWRGKRIRVRGILFAWGGPAIEINMAQAIELLD